ncbi:MAG TPA: IclR family transcriptional regulator [Bryobacteraceae bacterium]|nr:IclR family transcriptional regulator [Bryobacteraceae bacterium]
MQESFSVNSVARAMHILEMLDTSTRGMNISEISRRLGIPKSTTHLIVLTLEDLGYLTKSSRNLYQLSLKAYTLGRERMQGLSLPSIALPTMKSLAADTGLTVHLSVLEKYQAVIVQKVHGASSRFDTFVGKRISLHCTATGKVLLAHASAGTQKQVLSKTVFMRHTRHTLTSTAQLESALEAVRQTGYAVDDEEEELAVRCVAVPVTAAANDCIAALSVSGTVEEIPLDGCGRLVLALQQAASAIVRVLMEEELAAS